MGQLAEAIMRREWGQLLSQPVANLRNHPPDFQPHIGFLHQPPQPTQPSQPTQAPLKGPQVENVKAISTLRSGKVLNDPYKAQSSSSQVQEEEVEVAEESIKDKLGGEDKGKGNLIEDSMSYQPRVPFPNALKAKPTNKKTLA